MGERKGMKGLELWCRKMAEGYPGVKIDNMTTSWRDGLAFCAIIHHFRPDLIDFEKLNKDDIFHNNELAFRVAEHHLGIPALLEPEDMVEYEVPDRLSILTYMSQFYQTFEVARGKSGARMAPKRPQTNPDHGIVSPASTSPPTKVAILASAGRVRREPCAKCGLPVFIAERLNVGKLLYHRTCFRCARCNSQLTLANYYETENGEFCCEICPDEEKLISKKLSSEHSVLSRSMSDEEKSANLQNFPEAPDAYSTHFETALEFPLDGELKKNFTLTGAESLEFTKARSHFFKSQIENPGTDSGNEDIPPDLPQNKPPPLIKNSSDEKETDSLVHSDSGFPSNKQDTSLNISDSVSEQTNHHFVTKDNVSSTGNIVRARMRLFENNEDKKSDVHRDSLNKQVPLDATQNKKAVVVAIDDLEDFDNISRKDIEFEDTPLDNSNISKKHSDSFRNRSAETELLVKQSDISKDSNLELGYNEAVNKFTTYKDIVIKENNVGLETNFPKSTTLTTELNENEVQTPQFCLLNSDSSVIEIINSSQEKETSVVTIEDSPLELNKEDVSKSQEIDKSVITIEDSPLETNTEAKSPAAISSDQSYISADDVISPQTNSSFETPAKRGYYTAFEVLSEKTEPSNLEISSDAVVSPKTSSLNECSFASQECLSSLSKETEGRTSNNESLLENLPSVENSESKTVEKDTLELTTEQKNGVSLGEKVLSNSLQSEIYLTESGSQGTTHNIPSSIQPEYPDDLNPFGDDEGEEQILAKPTPASRPKKKIIPSLEEKEIKGTPDALARIYTERLSYNPFEDDADQDVEEQKVVLMKPVPSPRQKRKIIVPMNISLNPFGSDEEEENIVPVPKPRITKTSHSSLARPDPRPRDALSITSRGSHGGSNSSISSGSAVGSARKKKPAPRPPLPFPKNEQLTTGEGGSVASSPSQSVCHSPTLTIRHRKSKRAPLPPNASTPTPFQRADLSDRLSSTALSPISFEKSSIPSEGNTDEIQSEKNVKDEENRNRKSQTPSSLPSTVPIENSTRLSVPNKSTFGKWKRRKGQAPSRPIPERRIIKSLPISEIRRELDTIEIQQQGLEKQGVRLEEIIREKCEGDEDDNTNNPDEVLPIEVEDLILQLFELVNEKNELFRRQAELMYLRRQQRLEEEHADVEYQIRCLMLQPEANKTDSDKAREEALINRLVEIVERRNEIIECLEMDRVREAEEDDSINSQLNLYSLKRESDKEQSNSDEKKSKKKKHKKFKIIHSLHKHKEKGHKVDIDKDVDESETNPSTEKKKKKKFNLF